MKEYKMIAPNDPEEMAIAREGSWLCNMFQEFQLSADEKQEVIKSLIHDFKKSKEPLHG